MNLGPDLPVEAYATAIRLYHPSFVCISFNVAEAAQNFTQGWELLLIEAQRAEISIVVGGRAFPRNAAADLACVQHLPNMEALAAWIQDSTETE